MTGRLTSERSDLMDLYRTRTTEYVGFTMTLAVVFFTEVALTGIKIGEITIEPSSLPFQFIIAAAGVTVGLVFETLRRAAVWAHFLGAALSLSIGQDNKTIQMPNDADGLVWLHEYYYCEMMSRRVFRIIPGKLAFVSGLGSVLIEVGFFLSLTEVLNTYFAGVTSLALIMLVLGFVAVVIGAYVFVADWRNSAKYLVYKIRLKETSGPDP